MSLLNKIRFSIAIRLSLIFFSVFLLALGLIFIFVVPSLKNQLTDQKLQNLDNYAKLFTESYTNAFNQNASPTYLGLLTQNAADQADARILLFSGTGDLLSDSLKGQAYNAADYPVVGRTISSRQPGQSVNSVNDRNYGMAAVPVFDSTGKLVAVIVVSSSMNDVESAVTLVQRLVIESSMGAILLALIAIYVVSRLLARRIRRIESGAMLIAQGDFGVRVPVRSQDELGQLATAFNDMGDKLGSAFQRIDVEKRRAQLLLDDLHEGVLGVDTAGNIIVANPAAERLLGREITPPCTLSKFVNEDIYDLWKSMKPESPNREDTFMTAEDRALQVHSSFLSDQVELSSLLVLRDVSQEVKLERSRRDFIANASHELKTPLFSLGGFLEILQDEEVDEDTKREFVSTMREQVDRLANLARDLLDLSRMDSGAVSVEASSIELREVIGSVAREFPALADDSRIDIGGVPAGMTARCDRDRTVQLVRILLDNALKYSPPASPVEVSAGSVNGGSMISFTVADHGMGIPPEELPRVFERFYRGRSAGRVRGTGLGLSIAHELARLMNGAIEVDSGDGVTVFTVTLPAGTAGRSAGVAV